MKLDSKSRNLLIGLLGIVILAVVYMYVYQSMMDKANALENENLGLYETKTQYEAEAAHEDEYKQQIVDLTSNKEKLLAEFPAGTSREDEIMYWANMERENAGQVEMDNLTMANWEMVAGGQTSSEGGDETATELRLYKAPVNYSFSATYDGMKSMVDYVFAQPDEKKSIENFAIAFDQSTGNLVGTIDINMYYMTGTGKEYTPATIPSVPTGVANVFGATNTEVVSDDADAVSEFGEEGGEEATEE